MSNYPVRCALCECRTTKVGAGGIYFAHGGCRAEWQLCVGCAERLHAASKAESAELLSMIEATLDDAGVCGA